MNFVCPSCKRVLDAQRKKRKQCSSCGGKVPLGLLLAEAGSVALAKEEASIEARHREGRALSKRQKLIRMLRGLDPGGAEFYTAAAAHFRKSNRPNRTYGLFFLFLGFLALVLFVIIGAQNGHFAWVLLPAYLWFGVLGLPALYRGRATPRILAEGSKAEDENGRLRRLRTVAVHNSADPISALVLELMDQTGRR